MASAKKTLNPLTETPSNKVEVTKPFMLAYMRQVANAEDKAWFKKIVANPDNQKEYTKELAIWISIFPKFVNSLLTAFSLSLMLGKKRIRTLLILFLTSKYKLGARYTALLLVLILMTFSS